MSSCYPSNGIVVISCDEKPPESVIQSILDVDTAPELSVEIECIKGYEWKIKTKYYIAKAMMYPITEKRDFNSTFAESIQSVVFYFNGNKDSSFQDVVSWMPLLKAVTPEVQLLICENCSHRESHKKDILDWCIENEFELVELQEDETENDSDINSKNGGYCRVRDALHTCSWSDLILINQASNSSDTTVTNGVKSEASNLNKNQKPIESAKQIKVGNQEVKLEEEWMKKVLEQDESGEESFEALFAKFASMKEKASNLEGEERKKYAEEVAIAFCRAMGCEDEIEGLDSD